MKSIDVGFVKIGNKEFLFVNSVGVGFDAEVAKESLKIHWLAGISKYLLSVVKTLSKYKSSLMRIELDNRVIEQKTFLVAIGNGISSGGGFLLTPHALLDDGALDVRIASDLSIPKVLQILPKAINGTHEKYSEVLMTKSRNINIQSESPVLIHRDGEVSVSRITEIAVRTMARCLKVTA